MPQIVNFNKELNIIEVHSSGDISAEDVKKTISQIADIRREHGLNKVLVDCREQSSALGTMDTFQVVVKDDHRGIRTAVLVIAGQAAEEGNKFAETVAANRGFALKVFYTKEEAMEWLNS